MSNGFEFVDMFLNNWGYAGGLVLLAIACFSQNMAFTAVSRSRNGSDTAYHRRMAWMSNGVWFVCHFFVLSNVWAVLMTGVWWKLPPVFIIYGLATAEGSVVMMKRLIKSEQGKRRVGNAAIEKLEAELKIMNAKVLALHVRVNRLSKEVD